MAQHTHLVIAYNHDTKSFWFDGDGSREWIRRLFTPETNTWSDEEEGYVVAPVSMEEEAVNALALLGVEVSETDWQER
jgi:hypothetical protein